MWFSIYAVHLQRNIVSKYFLYHFGFQFAIPLCGQNKYDSLFPWWIWAIDWYNLVFSVAASDLGRCHYGDVKCLREIIGVYAKTLKNGRRDLNLVPIDPLHVDEVIINQGNTSPVNINLKFRDMKCHGLSTATVRKVVWVNFSFVMQTVIWLICFNCSGFEKDIATSKYEIYANIDRISLVGQYKARGNILLLPINGNGAANLTFGKSLI